MKKPAQVLFQGGQLTSIGEVERRLAAIQEMQRLLGKDGVSNNPPTARKGAVQHPARTSSEKTSKISKT